MSHLGHVGKAVVVVIMGLVQYLIVTKESRTPLVRQLEIGTKISLQLQVAVEIQIRIGPRCGLWLLELYIDLSRDALITVLDR